MLPVSLKLPVTISQQGRRWVAYSPAFDIATSGTSERDARKKFEKLVQLFLEELSEAGTTKDILTELGWKKVRARFEPPRVSQKSIQVKIPTLA